MTIAVIETLESRRLLSNYTLGQIGSFGLNDTGANPHSSLVADTAGDLFGTTFNGGPYGVGTAFEIPAGTTTIITLTTFNGANGANPNGLTLDSDGNLYGTTQEGGSGGLGTVFEIRNGSNTITTLASFDNSNGYLPQAGLTLDAAGNLYGTTRVGGSGGFGMVFEMQSQSTIVTTLASFNGTNGGYPVAAVTLDSAGNVYGTTSAGGAMGSNGAIFEIIKGSATITKLASFNGANGAAPNANVALDPAGNLYTTASQGGPSNYGTVVELAKGSTTLTTLDSFNGANGLYPAGGLTLDSAGNLYGTTSQGGPSFHPGFGGFGTVFEIAHGSTTLTTLASFNGTNGANPLAGLTLDAAGNLYGTTEGGGASGEGLVFEIPRGSTTITTLAVLNGTNGVLPEGDVTLDSVGNLDGTTSQGGPSNDGTVFEVVKGSTSVTTLASFNGTNGATPLAGVTLDSAGDLYGTTHYGGASGDGTVFEIPKGSTTITTLVSFNGAIGTNPVGGVTLDAAGNLYGTTEVGGVNGAGTIFEIAKGSAVVTTLAAFNITNGSSLVAGVTLDSNGNLYGTTNLGGASAGVGNNGYGTVFELAKGSATISTLGSFNFKTDGGNPQAGVTLDAEGNVYGTTYQGGVGNAGTVFEVIKGSKTITTLISFNQRNGANPYGGVILDSAGNLYGATEGGGDGGNGTVFEIVKGSGIVTTLASFSGPNLTGSSSGPNGSFPNGVTLSSAGSLYGTTRFGGPGNVGMVFKLFPPSIPGDANFDGKVDFADLVIVAAHYGKPTTTWADGDFNADGFVGFDDLVILAAYYGRSLPATAAPALPHAFHNALSPALRHRSR